MDIEKAKARLLAKIDSIRRDTESTMGEFLNNSSQYGWAYAFEWSDRAFEAAAQQKVCNEVFVWLNHSKKPASLEDVEKELREMMVRGSKYPSSSSSQTTNLMSVYRLKAVTEMWEALTNIMANS